MVKRICIACVLVFLWFILYHHHTRDALAGIKDTLGKAPEVVDPDITITAHAAKISQLVGEYDRERKQYTLNRTYSNWKLKGTDLGVPFRYKGRTYILFGDTQGAKEKDRDAIAYTTDSLPDGGLKLTFLHDADNIYKPITIPNIEQGAFDVPMEGIEVNDIMYVYSTTGHSATKAMGRSVLARSRDDGNTFDLLYTLSAKHFINVSIMKTDADKWPNLPHNIKGQVLILFGSGSYRKSDVYLACQPAENIEDPHTIQYFAGMDNNNNVTWSKDEQMAIPLFDQPQVGELSVTYNAFIDRWIMLYNASNPGGINMRTARYPWGPWTKPMVLYDPWKNGGYCHYIHTSWQSQRCDSIMDPGRENDWGGVYGPYQYASFAKGDSTPSKSSTTIYFNMSTWNPYTVVLMKATLQKN